MPSDGLEICLWGYNSSMQTSFSVTSGINLAHYAARSFLKWAGNKGQLVEKLASIVLDELQNDMRSSGL